MKDKLKGIIIARRGHRGPRGGRSGHRRRSGAAATTTATDKAITGTALDQASAAALKATGGGKVTQTEVNDEESYYEVEVTRGDGSQVDVQLDRGFHLVGQKVDHEGR